MSMTCEIILHDVWLVGADFTGVGYHHFDIGVASVMVDEALRQVRCHMRLGLVGSQEMVLCCTRQARSNEV